MGSARLASSLHLGRTGAMQGRMPKIDLSTVPVRRRQGYPEDFRAETAGYEGQRVGDAAGLTQFGVNRVVLPPQARTALRHWHENEDEFVIVMSGEVVLREEDGETVLRAGDCAGFKAGVGPREVRAVGGV